MKQSWLVCQLSLTFALAVSSSCYVKFWALEDSEELSLSLIFTLISNAGFYLGHIFHSCMFYTKVKADETCFRACILCRYLLFYLVHKQGNKLPKPWVNKLEKSKQGMPNSSLKSCGTSLVSLTPWLHTQYCKHLHLKLDPQGRISPNMLSYLDLLTDHFSKLFGFPVYFWN